MHVKRTLQKKVSCLQQVPLIQPGHIRVKFGSDPDYYPGQWVIQVTGTDPVSTLISSIRHYTYPERLQIPNLPSLYYRRYGGDMILMYQITNKKVNGSLQNLFTILPASATRGHNFKFFKHSCTSHPRKIHFPSDLSITGIIYHPTLSMLTLLTLSKNFYYIIFVLTCYLLFPSYTHTHTQFVIDQVFTGY